jgi:hypothetical protein
LFIGAAWRFALLIHFVHRRGMARRLLIHFVHWHGMALRFIDSLCSSARHGASLY